MGEQLRILLVEDSEDDALLTVLQLRQGGYEPSYKRVETLDAMNKAMDEEQWDLIISDYSLPHFNGLDTLKLYKEKGLDTPFIVVSGAIGEETAVELMRMGVHDYIMKNNLARLAPAVARELKDAAVREERREADRQIKAALEEKTALLAEIHHRVKNNMAVIISLLSLQEKEIKNDEDRQKFRETQSRIRSMAMVHEMLYSSDDLSKIEFDGYIRRLANNLSISYGLDKTSIGIKLDLVDEIILNIENAVPCGLLINELVTNSIWHAFPDGREGTITVSLSKGDGEKEVMVSVTDNGVGMPEGVSFDNINSLGIKLIKTLNDQLGGDMEFNAENGTSFVIRFTENPYSQRI
ncbi:hypothetical protein LCGC14_2352900 [marine sediment metagenome]|uniref:Response regulatory domain-containing protein n=1 Tax=marine sediment metagenome TaxID=412755 RepID=A0A0F9C961_9ZZZZ